MERSSKVSIDEIIERSGVHPKIIHFAIFNGYRWAASDLTLVEQYDRIHRMNPEMDRDDVLLMMGDDLKDDIAEFFNQAFPVVEKRSA